MNQKMYTIVVGLANLTLATTLSPIWKINLGVGLFCIACAVFIPNDE